MKNLKRLLGYFKGLIPLTLIGLTATLIASATDEISPLVTKSIVDDVLEGRQFDLLGVLLLALIGLALGRALCVYCKNIMFETVSQSIVRKFRSQLFDKLQTQTFAYFDRTPAGTLMNRVVGDLNAVESFVTETLRMTFLHSITLVLTVISMFLLSPRLAAVLMILLPLLFLCTRTMSKKLKPAYVGVRKAFEGLSSFVTEQINGVRVIKVFGRELHSGERFRKVTGRYRDANLDAAYIRSNYQPGIGLIMNLGLVIVLLVGGMEVINERMSIGTLVAFNSYVQLLRPGVNAINNTFNQFANANASLEKLFEILDSEPEIATPDNAYAPETVKGVVDYEHVSFAYGDREIISDFNMHLEPGKVTAIMGAVGSGKSTITNLMPRFYDVTAGSVKVDGVDVRQWDLKALRRSIGTVMQEVFIFSDTIQENIAFGVPGASLEEVQEAARIAGADEFIMDEKKGYDTLVGERGVGLSGGQKQRIAIARAMITKPAVLILDDSTSSVDTETEKKIQNEIAARKDSLAMLVIAHRISSVMNADHIIFLENGRIAEEGTHEELLAKKGLYYNIFMEQRTDYGLAETAAEVKA